MLMAIFIEMKNVLQGASPPVAHCVQLSRLAVCFSNFFDRSSRFILKEFEINPFVFDARSRFVALDGFATIAKRVGPGQATTTNHLDQLTPFFEPRGIAVVGVSRIPA